MSTTAAAQRVRAGVQRVRQGPLGRRARARLPEVVLGVGLVAGGALAAVLWATNEPTQRILVAARAIQRGESLDSSMVRWASVGGDRLTGIGEPTGLGGRIAAVDIAAGSPLQVEAFRDPVAITSEQTEVGLALDPGDFPAGLEVGDMVLVVVVPPTEPGGATPVARTLPSEALVLGVPNEVPAPGQDLVVNLLVLRTDVEALATAVDVRLARVAEDAADQQPGA